MNLKPYTVILTFLNPREGAPRHIEHVMASTPAQADETAREQLVERLCTDPDDDPNGPDWQFNVLAVFEGHLTDARYTR